MSVQSPEFDQKRHVMSAVSRYVCRTEMNSDISMPRVEDGPQEVSLTSVLNRTCLPSCLDKDP